MYGTDSTLTLENLLELLEDVQDLDCDKFSYYLDIPRATRAKIIRDHKKEPLSSILRALLSEWLCHHPVPTWKLVANALSWMGRKHDKLHCVLKTIYEAKKFLLAPESRRLTSALNRAFEEGGTHEQVIVQLHLSGTARSGKTSLIRRLMGKKAREIEPSTGVADKAVRVDIMKQSVIVDKTVWREIRSLNEESTIILNGIRGDMSKADTVATDYDCVIVPGSPKATSITTDDGIHTAAEKQLEESSTHSSVNPKGVFEKAIEAAQVELCQMKDPLSIYITDIGGQHEFQELVPALVSGPSVFLVVIPAHWGLNKTFPVEYLNQDGSLGSSYHTNITLKQYILKTLATIMCVGHRDTTSECPKILFVLTFKDKVQAEELIALDRELQIAVKSTVAYEDSKIEFASDDNLCFSINNLADDDTDIELIRQAIERIGRSNDEYNVRTPYSWQFFGVTLRSLMNEAQPIVNYSQCIEIGRKCGIFDRKELNDALNHFHKQTGVLRYYHYIPELQDIIFLNPQVLFDKVSELVTSSFSFEKVGKYKSEQFYKQGIFPIKSLNNKRGCFACPDSPFTPTKFIAFLKHHHIIAPLKGMDKFFLPCSLTHANLCDTATASSILPLLISFKGGFIPRGMFGFLIAAILEDTKFSLETGHNLDQIYQNQVTFQVGAYLDTFKLTACSSYICLQVVPSTVTHPYSLSDVFCFVKNRVVQILDDLTHQFHYNVHTDKLLAFICPHSVETEEHPATIIFDTAVNQPASLKCSMTGHAFNLPIGHQVWFGKSEDVGDEMPSFAQLTFLQSCNGENIEIIKSTAPSWEDIGALMDFDKAGNYLILVRKKYGEKDPVACSRDIFQHWLQGNGKLPLTWKSVTELLENVRYPNLAKSVRTTIGF